MVQDLHYHVTCLPLQLDAVGGRVKWNLRFASVSVSRPYAVVVVRVVRVGRGRPIGNGGDLVSVVMPVARQAAAASQRGPTYSSTDTRVRLWRPSPPRIRAKLTGIEPSI